MRGLVLLTALVIIAALPVLAQPVYRPTATYGVTQGDFTNTTVAIPAISTQVTLAAASSSITISVPPGGADLYVDLNNGTASSADFMIPAGSSFTFEGVPPIKLFKVKGSAASGNYSVFAH